MKLKGFFLVGKKHPLPFPTTSTNAQRRTILELRYTQVPNFQRFVMLVKG